VKFKKGETVIYPQHGACIVQGTQKKTMLGETREYLVLRPVIGEMTLSVPLFSPALSGHADRLSRGAPEPRGTGLTEDEGLRKVEFFERFDAQQSRAMHGRADRRVLFKDDDVMPALGEQACRRGAGRSGPDDDYITHVWLLANSCVECSDAPLCHAGRIVYRSHRPPFQRRRA